ncbi:hypothetical protein QCA50_014171 [Cerrena zonata]|uniref:Uncharacterized protein n=1 Tax=Cerrena zonata TaxID=2478898 RepID=A0AAW0FU15_9APHY
MPPARVALQPNSLYIATQTILIPDTNTEVNFERGAWHWSFFFTDATGNITQLHWNVATVEENSGEYFVRNSLTDTTVLARIDPTTVYVSFLRLSGWTNPGLETLAATLDALYKEHEGKPPALLRSMIPLRSCRTWILDAVDIFDRNRWMTVPVDLEGTVKKESKDATDRYAEMIESWIMDLDQFKPTVKDI